MARRGQKPEGFEEDEDWDMSEWFDKPQGPDPFTLKSFVLITGASGGLCSALAKRFASEFPAGSCLGLLARDQGKLEALKADIQRQYPGIKVITISQDLGDIHSASFKNCVDRAFQQHQLSPSQFDQGILVHGVSSIGDVSKYLAQQNNVKDLKAFYNLNVVSMLILQSQFLHKFPQGSVKQRMVVAFSSDAADLPYKSLGLYCSAKACREMLLGVLALEEEDLRVFVYDPGDVDTPMQTEFIKNSCDELNRELAIMTVQMGYLLTVEESIDKMIELLHANTFWSGERETVNENYSDPVSFRKELIAVLNDRRAQEGKPKL